MQYRAVGRNEAYKQRHRPGGVRRTTQTRIEGANPRLDAIEHTFRNIRTTNIAPLG